ncbi:MAG: PilZ domain-containing protein [Phycisphaerae bacterium]
MSTAQLIAKEKRDQILEGSIQQQRQLVLTHNSLEGWRTFKSSFVSGSASSGVALIKAPIPRDELVSRLPEPGDTLGVTFRLGHKKCMFGTILEPNQDQAQEGLVALRWPDHLQQLQRRVYERAEPPKGIVIPVRFRREGDASGSPVEARPVRHGQLEDMSAGGMRVKVADANDFQPGCTYRCVFAPHPGKPSLVVDALVRHREAADQGRASIGFQFIGLEATPEGRRVLDRLAQTVSHFQHARSRRQR